MDSVKDLLGVLGRIEAAIEGAHAIKMTMRSRMRDYRSVLEALQGSAPAAFKHELQRLQDLFTEMEDLHANHTADPEDGRLAKMAKTINRSTQHKSIGEVLDAIDRDVVRQFTAISAKSSINAEGVKTALEKLRPPPLQDMAAVPAGALELPPSYVERSAAQQVADGITKSEEPRTPYTVVGMGGGGKSVLASAVVRKSNVREHFRGGIFWLRVGRGAKNRLLTLLQGLAREMGAAPTDAPHGVPHVFDSLEKVQQHLGTVASTGNSRRLVVLDDVWEREVVDALLPLGVKVLVTTRDRSVVGVPTGCLELGDMTEEEALELLLKTSGTVGRPGDSVPMVMTKVVALCGRLPLVLAIAGSMPLVKGNGLSAGAWGKLVEELEDVATKMDASDEGSDSLQFVLETSFNALTLAKKRAFKKTAVLAPGAIASTQMLLNLWETEDTGGTREEAEGLVSKCLLQDVGGGGYRVHDLVLDFVKIKIKADVKMVEEATTLQARFLGRLDVLKGYAHPEHGAGNQGLFALDALWRSVEMLSGNPMLEVASYSTSLGELESCEATTDVASSYSSVGFFFNIQGKFSEAEPLYERCQAIEEKVLGPDHPSLATTLNNRAGLLESQGKLEDADPLYARVLEILGATVGEEHPNYASALNNRALLLESQGKYEEAEPLYERSLAIREKALGPDHPAGKYNEAQPLFERALAINEVALGVDHPSTITSRAWMADLYQKQGLLEKASPLLEQVVSARERVQGHDHPDVASALNNRAGLLRQQGKLSEADPLFQRALAIDEKVYGPDHPEVATDVNNRAGLLKQQGKFDQAEPLYERAIVIWEASLGSDHPQVAIGLNNRALLLECQGKFDEADRLYVRAIEIEEKTLGPDHPDLATSLNHRAALLESLGKFDEADPLYLRAIEIGEKTLGPDHPDLATRLNNRADKFAEAEPLYRRATEIWETALGPEHPNVATALNNRAGLLEKQGKFDEADPLYLRAIEIGEKTLGPVHPDLATRLNNRAGLLSAQGKFDEADPLYLRAIEIGEKTLAPDHPDLATRLNNRAGLLEKQGKFSEAEPLYRRATEIWETALGREHPNVATALNNRAGLLEGQGKFSEAEPLYERCQAVEEKVLGPDHPSLATTLNNRAGLLTKQGKFAEAEPLYRRATEIWETALGREHPNVATALNNRAGLLESQGKDNEALPLFERAVSIRRKTLGESHHSTVDTRISLERVRKRVLVNTRLITPGDEKQAGPSS
eukprot:g20568.t1